MRNIWDKYNADSMHPMKFSFDNFVYRLCRKGTECKDMNKVYQDLSKIKYDDENLGAHGESDKINSNVEFQALIDSKILPFDEWCYTNGIEYPITPNKNINYANSRE